MFPCKRDLTKYCRELYCLEHGIHPDGMMPADTSLGLGVLYIFLRKGLFLFLFVSIQIFPIKPYWTLPPRCSGRQFQHFLLRDWCWQTRAQSGVGVQDGVVRLHDSC